VRRVAELGSLTTLHMSLRKLIVLLVSFTLAYIFGEGLFPTPNAVGGGEAKMFVLIFLTVGFKVLIEYFLNRRRKKREDKHVDRTVAMHRGEHRARLLLRAGRFLARRH